MNNELPITDSTSQTEINRRRFLEAAGFTLSVAAINGCGRAPTETAFPFAVQPEGVTPGRMRSYASTCAGCPAACGLLVGVRDGRPLKMEGMPEHPLSQGGLCAIGQAMPLGLYDRLRLKQPLQRGNPASWSEVDDAIIKKLDEVGGKGAVRFVTPTITSPTLKAAIDSLLAQYDDAKHVTFDAVSSSAILDAHEKTHGVRLLPHFKLERAKVIVSFGADFLGTWISPVEFTKAWSTNRVPTEEHREMSYHVQLEGRMSLTGMKADKRYRLLPNDYGGVLSRIALELAKRAGQSPPKGKTGKSPVTDDDLSELSDRLWKSRGESVVLCDSQSVDVQVLVNFVNHTLGNYGETLDIKRPSQQRQGNDADVVKLIEELNGGKVSALFVAGTDLTHNLPDRDSLVKAIKTVPLTVSFVEREDDFASLADFVCPDHHPLESWMDAEPISGTVSFSQPTLAPLGETRSVLESIGRWMGQKKSAYEMIRGYWEKSIPWDEAVHDGVVQVDSGSAAVDDFQPDAVRLLAEEKSTNGYSVVLYNKIGLTDSRHAHNPWLQELPDPVTKATWDNYVCVSPEAAKELGVSDGDVIRVGVDGQSVELPALIQPGQHDRVVAIALNYGVKGTDRFANIGPQWLEGRPTVDEGKLVGKNVAGFVEARDGRLQYTRGNVKLTKTGEYRELATTQQYNSLEMPPNVAPHGGEFRDPVQATTLAAFQKDTHAGTPHHHHLADEQLWSEDHPKDRHWWGMTIDLNKCTGCSACLIACQSENNVPVVGKDEVRRQREMHWIRIDRYYNGEDDDVNVLQQPMMCQHCDNAPCETVCPVLATVHSEEGLNEQAYNRCVGTRYCANNCPYKVRRFNWFDYPHDDELQNLALNPDVTVRTRGVMEKCSMCVQRIEDGKIEAKRLGIRLADGMIQTACQQSCPSQAITFGDMNDLKLLFTVPFDSKNAENARDSLVLDEQQVSDSLRKQFQDVNRPLPEDVRVSILEEGREWRIIAAGSGFIVRLAAKSLNAYEESRVRTSLADPRHYGVLEEFNFRPSISYLRVVKNSDEHHDEDGTHG